MYRAWASSRRQGLLVVGAWAAPSSLASPSTFFGGQVPGQGIFVITPAHQQTAMMAGLQVRKIQRNYTCILSSHDMRCIGFTLGGGSFFSMILRGVIAGFCSNGEPFGGA